MRKVVFGVANSLDNFIAGPDGSVDWLRWSEDVNTLMQTYWQSVDTVLMGRKTFEVTGGGSGAGPHTRGYVFTRTLEPRVEGDVEIVNGDAEPFVRDLKNGDGQDICVLGGAVLARSLFEADLIDEVGVNIHPLLLGSGVPLFGSLKRPIELALTECKPMANDCVCLTYRVIH
ncbi:MAG: dihydrofolate reductase [bacterium]|nr:dihydrofolate reductase [bacterium]